MFSSVADIQDSGLESGGKLGVLLAIASWRAAPNARDGAPIGPDEAKVSLAQIGLSARLGERQVIRVIDELRGKNGGPALIIRKKKGGRYQSASVYQFTDDRFLRVATAMRIARRAVYAGLTKRVAAMDLMGRRADAEGCKAMIEACLWVCEREDKTSVIPVLQAMLLEPFHDLSLADLEAASARVSDPVLGAGLEPCETGVSTRQNVRLKKGVNMTFATHQPDICCTPYKDNPSRVSYKNARAGAHANDLPAGQSEVSAEDVCLSALAREAGAQREMIERLREASWRREGGTLIVVAHTPWVRDKLIGMARKPLLDTAKLLGLDGAKIVLEAKRKTLKTQKPDEIGKGTRR